MIAFFAGPDAQSPSGSKRADAPRRRRRRKERETQPNSDSKEHGLSEVHFGEPGHSYKRNLIEKLQLVQAESFLDAEGNKARFIEVKL